MLFEDIIYNLRWVFLVLFHGVLAIHIFVYGRYIGFLRSVFHLFFLPADLPNLYKLGFSEKNIPRHDRIFLMIEFMLILAIISVLLFFCFSLLFSSSNKPKMYDPDFPSVQIEVFLDGTFLSDGNKDSLQALHMITRSRSFLMPSISKHCEEEDVLPIYKKFYKNIYIAAGNSPGRFFIQVKMKKGQITGASDILLDLAEMLEKKTTNISAETFKISMGRRMADCRIQVVREAHAPIKPH